MPASFLGSGLTINVVNTGTLGTDHVHNYSTNAALDVSTVGTGDVDISTDSTQPNGTADVNITATDAINLNPGSLTSGGVKVQGGKTFQSDTYSTTTPNADMTSLVDYTGMGSTGHWKVFAGDNTNTLDMDDVGNVTASATLSSPSIHATAVGGFVLPADTTQSMTITGPFSTSATFTFRKLNSTTAVVFWPAWTGTSSSGTSFSCTGTPAAFIPLAQQKSYNVAVTDSGSIQTSPGLVNIASGSGNFTFQKTMAGGNFTGSGTAAVSEGHMVYKLS